MTWSIPGLNKRETALLVWLAVFILFGLANADLRTSIGGVLKTLFSSAWLLGTMISAAAYAAAAVVLIRHFGFWDAEMTKLAVVWFVGFALVAVFNTTRTTDARYYRRLVLHNLTLAVAVEFVVNLHTFPLPIELLLVPLAFLLVMTQAVAEINAEFSPARTVIAWCLGLLGAVSLSFSLAHVAGHFDEVATTEKVKEFLLPLALTACFVPFLVGLRFVVVYQTLLCMIRFGFRENERLYRFARRSIIRACGASLGRAQLFEERFRGRLWGVTDETEVTCVVEEFRRACDTGLSDERAA
jgi:hypothetical protein